MMPGEGGCLDLAFVSPVPGSPRSSLVHGREDRYAKAISRRGLSPFRGMGSCARSVSAGESLSDNPVRSRHSRHLC